MSELKPCPFCGSDKLNVGLIRATASLSYWSVECASCGVEIGDDESEDAVVTHWNTRAAPLPAGDDGELVAWLLRSVDNPSSPPLQQRRIRQAADRIAALNAEVARLAAENRKMRAQIMSEMIAADADLYTLGDRHE